VRDEVLARRDRAKRDLDAFVAASYADLAPLVHAVQGAIAEYERLKARAGRLDFLDLLIKARDLIRDNAAVRGELQRRYTHFFIDEFQDTDPLQVEILLLLAAGDCAGTDWGTLRPVPGKLFLVGDPKQSIYRFRRADIELYEKVKARLIEADAQLLELTTSFRSPPSMEYFVNISSTRRFLMRWRRDPTAARPATSPQKVPPRNRRPADARRPAGTAALWGLWQDRKGASGGILPCGPSAPSSKQHGAAVPIRPRHIAILFRRFRNFDADVTRGYVRALEARRIPHVLVGGRSFHDREEIIALSAALTAIEWPDDELNIFATLRGPFLALSDEALLLFRRDVGADGSPESAT
jgi:ATP-dependent exoDNAse (exonuclease V) beta subunit